MRLRTTETHWEEGKTFIEQLKLQSLLKSLPTASQRQLSSKVTES